MLTSSKSFCIKFILVMCHLDEHIISYLWCRITVSVVTSRVKVLFVNHPELLEGLNQFLPTGYKISVPFSRKSGFDFEEAMRFVNRVKVHCQKQLN